MFAAIDPGQQLATANFVLALSAAFSIGLPLILINGSKNTCKKDLLVLTPEELAYEIEIFGWLVE